MPSVNVSTWNEIRNVDQDCIIPQRWEIPVSTNGMTLIPSSHHVLTMGPPLQISSQHQHQHQHQQHPQPVSFRSPANSIPIMNNQHAQYMSEIRILEREFPLVYTLLLQQQSIMEQQRAQMENATREIDRLNGELSRLQTCPTQYKDNIPPVILVEKDGNSLNSDKGGSSDNNYESLPLKKRRRESDTKQNLSKVLRILSAATSSSV